MSMPFRNFFMKLLCCLFLLSGAAHAQNPAPMALTDCLDVRVATTTKTPLDLWRSILTCVKEDKYEQAIFMFGLAGSLGVFDSMRVKDVSAHQATQILSMGGMAAMGEDKSKLFRQQIQAKFGDATKKRLELCKTYKGMSPPSYFPEYMINHGLATYLGKNADPFVSGFYAAQAWPQAVDRYMQCPKG